MRPAPNSEHAEIGRSSVVPAKIRDVADAVALLAPMFAGQRREQFRALLLGKAGDVFEIIAASGTRESVDFPTRTIFSRALQWNADGIILAHNHPSGDPSPSRADIAVTAGIASTASCLGGFARSIISFSATRASGAFANTV